VTRIDEIDFSIAIGGRFSGLNRFPQSLGNMFFREKKSHGKSTKNEK
jgi:hypothetical protein